MSDQPQQAEEKPVVCHEESESLQRLLRLVASEVVRRLKAEQSVSNESPNSSSSDER